MSSRSVEVQLSRGQDRSCSLPLVIAQAYQTALLLLRIFIGLQLDHPECH